MFSLHPILYIISIVKVYMYIEGYFLALKLWWLASYIYNIGCTARACIQCSLHVKLKAMRKKAELP